MNVRDVILVSANRSATDEPEALDVVVGPTTVQGVPHADVVLMANPEMTARDLVDVLLALAARIDVRGVEGW